jgi:hypothetical protein
MSMPKIPVVCCKCERTLKGVCAVSVGGRSPLSIDVICLHVEPSTGLHCLQQHEVVP